MKDPNPWGVDPEAPSIPFYCGQTDTDHLIARFDKLCPACKKEILWQKPGTRTFDKWPVSCPPVEPDAA